MPVKTQDQEFIKNEMENMVERYKNGRQNQSPAAFAANYIEVMIDRLINESNTRTSNRSNLRIRRHDLPYPFDGRFCLFGMSRDTGHFTDIESATISQIALYMHDALNGEVLLRALEDLEAAIEDAGFSVAVDQVGLLLGLVTRKKTIAPSVKLTNKKGRIVCKLKNPDVRAIKQAIPHLVAIGNATHQPGMSTPFVEFVNRYTVLNSKDVLCDDGNVSIEVYKKHLNICFAPDTFSALHEFLQAHRLADCLTPRVEIAA